MLEDDDYVYFFLREQAVEYINCGKVSITYIARWQFSYQISSKKFSFTTFSFDSMIHLP